MQKCILGQTHKVLGLEEWLMQNLSNPVLRHTGRGDQLYADCPFCGKENNHFSVGLDNGLFKCYICGNGRGKAGGNYKELVSRISHIPYNKVDEQLIEGIRATSLWDITDVPPSHVIATAVSFKEVKGTVSISTQEEPLVRKALEYLKGRGIPTWRSFNLGVRVGTSGRYFGRVLIPIYFKGEVINFVARNILDRPDVLRYTGPSLYDGWTPKSECIFNYDAIQEGDEILIVEGIFDALPLFDDLNVIALLGKSLSDKQLYHILTLKPAKVTIILDGDVVSEFVRTPEYSVKKLASRFYGFVPHVRYNTMPSGIDPSDSPASARQKYLTAKELQ